MSSSSAVQPVVFLSHRGGPCWFMEDKTFASMDRRSEACRAFKKFPSVFSQGSATPKCIVVISAHWISEGSANIVEILGQDKHSLLYDYYGFPKETYDIKYPCPESPEVTHRIQSLMAASGFAVKIVSGKKRGLDHGVFIPLKLMFPEANIPVVQVSLLRNLDPGQHLELGEKLAPLRGEGVLIVGSGLVGLKLAYW